MKIERRKPLTANVGILSVGLDTYWEQFPGLLDEMTRKTAVLIGKVEHHSVTVTDFGMVDNARKAYEILPKLKAADLDLLFIDMVTYATSSTFGAVIREMNCPVVLVALQPLQAMDYAHGTTFMQLCNDDLCSIPEFTGVAVRMGRQPPPVILGMLENDPVADAELAEWCRVAHVLHDLRRARLGHMGHVLEAMLDMQTDPAAVTAAFGAHVVQCEADELLPIYRGIDPAGVEVAEMKRRILAFFDTPDPVSDPLTEKLTEASATPGNSLTVFSTVAAHTAQLMSKTGITCFSIRFPFGQTLNTPGRFLLIAHPDRPNESSHTALVERRLHGAFAIQHRSRFYGQTTGLYIAFERRGGFQHQHLGHHHVAGNATHHLGIHGHDVANHLARLSDNDLALAFQSPFERAVDANVFLRNNLTYNGSLRGERIVRHARKSILLCHICILFLYPQGHANLHRVAPAEVRVYFYISCKSRKNLPKYAHQV